MIARKKLENLKPELFHSETEIEVRYRDLDTFKHVNNAVYASYLEVGRLKYNKTFLADLIDWKERGFILGTNHIIYLKPLFLFDRVRIFTGVGKIGERSVTFVNLLQNQKGKSVAVAYSVLVAYDFIRDKTIGIPGEWRNIFKKVDKELLAYLSE